MALLAAYKLEKAYGGRTLFQDVSFEVADKDHIGLVGANGTGKTTLMQILMGVQNPDSGSVHRAKLLRIGCLEQTPAVLAGQTLYELVLEIFAPLLSAEHELEEISHKLQAAEVDLDALIRRQHQIQERYERDGGLTCRSRARAALQGLGFTEQDLSLSTAALSGGQLNKAMLARVLLSGAELLMLDEPTNHLDIASVEWLEAYLKSYTGAYIVISHDRYFLDQVTNRTIEITNGKTILTQGNYSAHVEHRSSAQEIALRHYRNTQKEIRRIFGIVEQQRRWNKERNIRTAESKLKQIERLKATLVEPEKDEESIRFTFSAREPGSNDMLIAENLKKSYDGKPVFSDVSLYIGKGEHVFLLGSNGCGKTTLLRILMGREGADGGVAAFGAGVQTAYYEQNMRSMDAEKTVLQEVWDAYPRMAHTSVRNALAAFLFRGDSVEKRISMLSGGERARVQLLKLMLSGANLLLLDEPTNHLDIASREALERALEEYDGTLFIVTHDRYLVNRMADRVLYMEPSRMMETVGGYDEFLLELTQAQQAQKEKETRDSDKPVNEYRAKKERQSAIARAKGVLARAERDVAQAEEEAAAIERQLVNPEVASDYVKAGELAQALAACKAAVEECYAQWEQAERELEALCAEE